MAINQNIPQAWENYVTQVNLGLEEVPHIFYDVLTYTDNATTRLTFFQQTNVAEDLTNMRASGMMVNPEAFLVQNISIFFRTTFETVDTGAAGAFPSQVGDIVLLANTGICKLKIGNKIYGPWPIWRLPASTFLKGMLSQAGAEAANLTQAYAQLDGPLYALFPNLMLSPLQAFSVELSWPSGAVNTSANVVIQVCLDGQLARSIQ